LCSELVWIASGRAGAERKIGNANLEAISERKLLILAEEPVERGANITICVRSYVLKGVAAACCMDEVLGCYVEVRLAPESRWTEQWFRPEHMLTVAEETRGDMSPKQIPLERASVTEELLPASFFG
jgi:hypothetical protein